MTDAPSPGFQPRDPHFDSRVRASFARQNAMAELGVRITALAPGALTFEMPFDARFTQHHGFMHAGAITTALDSACGYAAFTLMDANAEVLTVEFKANFLAPAKAELFRIRAEVLKPGRSITVCEAKAYGVTAGAEKLIASMTGTLMALTA